MKILEGWRRQDLKWQKTQSNGHKTTSILYSVGASETERDYLHTGQQQRDPHFYPDLLCGWKNMRKKTPPHPYFFNRSNACYIMIKVRKMCTFHQWVTRKQGFRMAAWWCRKSKSQMPQWMTHNKANHSSMMTDDKVYDASNWQQMTKSSTPQGNTHDKVHNASTDGTWQSPQGLNSMKIKHTSHACLLWNWLFFTLHASSAVKSVGTETS